MTRSQVAAPASSAFDYGAVTADFAGTLTTIANRIKAKVKRSIIDYIEIGRDLLAVKAELDHGLFLRWVSAEFGWNPRTAQRYMAAAEWAGDKSDIVSHLPATLVYTLASPTTPQEIKAKVRADLDAGRPLDVEAIKGRIREATRANHAPVQQVTQPDRQQHEPDLEPDPGEIDAERSAAAVEAVSILRKLSERDCQRLVALLRTTSLWQVLDLLARERT